MSFNRFWQIPIFGPFMSPCCLESSLWLAAWWPCSRLPVLCLIQLDGLYFCKKWAETWGSGRGVLHYRNYPFIIFFSVIDKYLLQKLCLTSIPFYFSQSFSSPQHDIKSKPKVSHELFIKSGETGNNLKHAGQWPLRNRMRHSFSKHIEIIISVEIFAFSSWLIFLKDRHLRFWDALRLVIPLLRWSTPASVNLQGNGTEKWLQTLLQCRQPCHWSCCETFT